MATHTEPDKRPPMTEKLKNNSDLLCNKCGKNTHSTGYHGKNGGARAGAGRKPGGMNYSTKQRLAIKKAFEDRIHQNADRLLNAALGKALGESYLMRKHTVGSGAKQRTEIEVVTDLQTIIAFLNGELNTAVYDDYYYISTKPVDMFAVKELYDRAFGKPNSKVENTGEQRLIIETRRHRTNASNGSH
jgi:hypothetical protein